MLRFPYRAATRALLVIALIVPPVQLGAAEMDVDTMVSAATTPADHRALAARYAAEAADARAKAEMHRKMAASYRKTGGAALKAQLPEHCDALVNVYEGAAKEFEAMASAHREMADGGK